MIRQYCVECIDEGVIITRGCREYGFDNPTGSTVLFRCDRPDDAIRLAYLAVAGLGAIRKFPMDWEIDVAKIEYTVKDKVDEYDEEGE